MIKVLVHLLEEITKRMENSELKDDRKIKTELFKSAQSLSQIFKSHVTPFVTTCYNCGQLNATKVILKTGVFAWIVTILAVLL